MSADYGFFGSKPFSRADAILAELGADPTTGPAVASTIDQLSGSVLV